MSDEDEALVGLLMAAHAAGYRAGERPSFGACRDFYSSVIDAVTDGPEIEGGDPHAELMRAVRRYRAGRRNNHPPQEIP